MVLDDKINRNCVDIYFPSSSRTCLHSCAVSSKSVREREGRKRVYQVVIDWRVPELPTETVVDWHSISLDVLAIGTCPVEDRRVKQRLLH